MPEYRWRSNFPAPKVPAPVFAQEVERIAGEGGNWAASSLAVLEAAKDPASPLHPAYNWDLGAAAEAHWLQRTRELIGALVIVRVETQTSPHQSTRAFYSVQPSAGRRGYVEQDRILSDDDLRSQVLQAARRDLQVYLAKYGGVVFTFGATGARRHLEAAMTEIESEIDRLNNLARARGRRRQPPPGGPHPQPPPST